MGPDGRIYMSYFGVDQVSAIMRPDEIGNGCDFVHDFISLPREKDNYSIHNSVVELNMLPDQDFIEDTLDLCTLSDAAVPAEFNYVLGQDTFVGGLPLDTEGTYLVKYGIGQCWDSTIVVVQSNIETLDSLYTICNDPLDIRLPFSRGSIIWDTGIEASTTTVYEPGEYGYSYKLGACEVRDTVYVFRQCPEVDESQVFLPNVFSPNGDGTNDRLELFTHLPLSNMNAFVFDRWGNQIHRSNDPRDLWDGKTNGTIVQEGVYVVLVEYSFANDEKTHQETHSVMMVR